MEISVGTWNGTLKSFHRMWKERKIIVAFLVLITTHNLLVGTPYTGNYGRPLHNHVLVVCNISHYI